MQRAAPPRLDRPQELRGQRDVDALFDEPPLELLLLDPDELVRDRRLDRLAHGVQRHAGLAVAHLAERLLQLALPPEKGDGNTLDLFRGRGLLQPSLRVALVGLPIHGGDSISCVSHRILLSSTVNRAWMPRLEL